MIPISRRRVYMFVIGMSLLGVGFCFLYLSISSLSVAFFLIGMMFMAFACLTVIINWQFWIEEVEERARSGERDDEEYTGD